MHGGEVLRQVLDRLRELRAYERTGTSVRAVDGAERVTRGAHHRLTAQKAGRALRDARARIAAPRLHVAGGLESGGARRRASA